MVDAAHGPGMLPLDVAALDADFWVGNLHKWAFAPRGAAFLWVRRDRQADVHPAVVSHHYGDRFSREFSWQGTRDLSAWFAAPRALQFTADLGGDAVREHNHAMAVWAHRFLWERLKIDKPLSPLDGSMLGSMAAFALPEQLGPIGEREFEALQQELYTRHRLEVPLMRWGGRLLFRVSCQLYNTPRQYERTAEVVGEILARRP